MIDNDVELNGMPIWFGAFKTNWIFHIDYAWVNDIYENHVDILLALNNVQWNMPSICKCMSIIFPVLKHENGEKQDDFKIGKSKRTKNWRHN